MFDIEEYNSKLHEVRPSDISKKWKDVYDKMTIHTRGVFPETLVGKKRPNETTQVYDYRKANYRAITKGEIHKNIDALYRILINSSYTIGMTDSLKEYLGNKTFYGYDFINFIHYYLLITDIEDPNALLVWIPTGEFIATQKVNVDALIVNSKDIIYLADEVVTWKHDDNTLYSLTKDWYYAHRRTEKGDRYTLVEIYNHNIGIPPAIVLKGNTKYDEDTGEIYYDSFFESFCPFAEEAINLFSDWQATMTTSGFPYRIETVSDCDNPACKGGYVEVDNEKEECKTCQGTGKKIINRSPYGVFFRDKPNALDGGVVDTVLPIEFVSPDVNAIINQKDSWQLCLKLASDNLNLKQTDEAQSGVAKVIDRENQYSFLSKICNNLYDNIIYYSLYFLEHYRDINYSDSPKIIKPTSFETKSESDIVNELSELKSKNIPRLFLIEAGKDLTKKRFSNNNIAQNIHDFISSTDILYGKDDTEVSIIKNEGIFKTEIFQYHYAVESILYELIQDNPDVMLKSIGEIKSLIVNKLAEYKNADNQNIYNPEGKIV